VSEAETIRKAFRPQRITTLFVGESAPVGEKFFYRRNSQVYRYMKQAFGGGEDFLEQFKAQGFFLDDLILEPANKLERRKRQQLRLESIPDLSKRMSIYRPSNVVALMIAIKPMVRDAMDRAGLLDCAFYATHFPGCGQQGNFRSEIAKIIPRLQTEFMHTQIGTA
jgi:hypothetical protein